QVTQTNGNGFDSNGCRYSIDQIEQIVREGAPAGTNRSDVFHQIIGHYVGCGWQVDRILQHLQQYPDGIGSRYLAEDRLRQEIDRSAGKYAKAELPLFDSWEAKAPPEPEQEAPQQPPPDEADPELEGHDLDDGELDDDGDLDEEAPEQDPNLPRLY